MFSGAQSYSVSESVSDNFPNSIIEIWVFHIVSIQSICELYFVATNYRYFGKLIDEEHIFKDMKKHVNKHFDEFLKIGLKFR